MNNNGNRSNGWSHVWVVPIVLLAMFALPSPWTARTGIETIPYSRFQQALAGGQIRDVVIDADTVRGSYVTPHGDTSQFIAYRVDPSLADVLSRYKVDFAAAPNLKWLGALISWAATFALFAFLWFGLRGPASTRLAGAGQSHARIYVKEHTGVAFDQVAGVDEAKAELIEVIEFLKNPAEYGRLGAHVPKGILLVGPPGTGKTLLARAVAGEAHVPFFSIGGSEFIELFVGVGAARVRDLFRQAKTRAPCIIFIDELDALGRSRGISALEGHDEREQTLNQLLAEMDGFDAREGVIVLAATNRPEVLDNALLRAGRFDRQVLVDRPDRAGRRAILAVHVKPVTIAPDLDLDAVAAMTTGFSGADLANLVNEAALEATRRHESAVGQDDFTSAIERIVAGLEKKTRILTPFERRVTAYHEMGHALVAMAQPDGETVHKVSIIPRGIGALGYTIQRPTEDRYLMTRRELDARICVLLGGRAAETLVFGHVSTGAADDLAKATDIARRMALSWGMEDDLGAVVFEKPRAAFLSPAETLPLPREYSEALAARIDAAVARRLDQALARAAAILRVNRAILDTCAKALLETETLDEGRLKALARGLRMPDDAVPVAASSVGRGALEHDQKTSA